MSELTGWKSGSLSSTVGRSTILFSVLWLSGCQGTSRPPVTRPDPQTPVLGFVDAERLLPYHPDARKLEALDRRINLAQRPLPASAGRPVREPAVVQLSLPEPVESKSPSREIDRERALTAVREDFEVRRRARPEQEEERYRRALEQLQRRFLELRREPRPEAASDDLAEAPAASATCRSSSIRCVRSLRIGSSTTPRSCAVGESCSA
jgi:hypothetical protein